MGNKRNYRIVIILLIFTIFLPCRFSIIQADSGCCSNHGGVDCEAGQDSDGSVICEDGWKNSSCSYSGMEKCKLGEKTNVINEPTTAINNDISRTISKKNGL